MVDQAQMLKGLLEGCILKIISEGETYGYIITENLNNNGFPHLNEGSVYPVLIRLQKKGLVNTESKKSPLGPKRKYFTLSELGKTYLSEFEKIWDETAQAVFNILRGGNYESNR